MVFHFSGQLGHHADAEIGLAASYATGFILHLNLVQPAVILFHDPNLIYRTVSSINRVTSVVPLVAQWARAGGFNCKPRDGTFSYARVLHLLRDLHRQHDHQRCGPALNLPAAIGQQYGIVTLIRNRYALQLQFRLRLAFHCHPIL